jgi:hypothetical protein
MLICSSLDYIVLCFKLLYRKEVPYEPVELNQGLLFNCSLMASKTVVLEVFGLLFLFLRTYISSHGTHSAPRLVTECGIS